MAYINQGNCENHWSCLWNSPCCLCGMFVIIQPLPKQLPYDHAYPCNKLYSAITYYYYELLY